MAQILDLGKIRFQFKGEWSSSTEYQFNDVVNYKGVAYVYISTAKTTGTVTSNTQFWGRMTSGFDFTGAWSNSTTYGYGSTVRYGGNLYLYINNVASSGNLPTNTTYWTLLMYGWNFQGTWSSTTAYKIGETVTYGGIAYVAVQDSTGQNPDANTAYWSTIIQGFQSEGTYSAGTAYQKNDLVNYGGNTYIAKTNTTGNLPTDTTYWTLFASGFNFESTWSSATAYQPGDVVTYGGIVYIAVIESTNQNPDANTTYWVTLAPGMQFESDYNNATAYQKNDIVVYGGTTYIAKTNTTGNIPTNTTFWNTFAPGINIRGAWSSATTYRPGDVVTLGGNLYTAVVEHSNQNPDANPTYWTTLIQGIQYEGTYNSGTAYQKNDIVKYGGNVYISTTNTTGNLPTNTANWEQLIANDGLASANVYYVAPHGSDTNNGSSIAAAFASIKYACQQAAAAGQTATIFVKTGTYSEQLPITVPANVAIVGDNQRTTIVQPKSGNSDDGTTPNSQSTMWLMSNGSILNKMTFIGMTGWVPGTTAADITTSTIKGVVARLNPNSPITTKSPYILECSAIGTGLIGALVDGSVHASGAKSMLFHGYTVISDNGVGYWIKDAGKAELVSCFTYYCYFGYASTAGGHVRALNGNNSYGTWGAVSRGFDSGETAVTGALLGQQLNFTYSGGTINIGDTVTASSGATGIVTNIQYSANKVYLRNTTGTFSVGNTLTFTGGGTGTVTTGALENQKGFVLVMNTLTAAPKPGQSIQIAGDSTAYVVQSTTGTYTNTSSIISVVLAQEKLTGSASGSVVTLRSKYSQIRLTGHDFLSIGTGGITTTNYPGTPTQPAAQGNETDESFPGRVFYVSTDQDGNFRVGEYFKIDQATGKATLNASAFDLSGLSSLRLGSIGAQLGETINEFSSDATLSGNSNLAVPTEYAVKTYVDSLGQFIGQTIFSPTKTKTNFLPCDGKVYLKTQYPQLATALGSIEEPTRWAPYNQAFSWGGISIPVDNFRFHARNTTDDYLYRYSSNSGFIERYSATDKSTQVGVSGYPAGSQSAFTPHSNSLHSHHATAIYKQRYFCIGGTDGTSLRAAYQIVDLLDFTKPAAGFTASNANSNAKVWANNTWLVITDIASSYIEWTNQTPSGGGGMTLSGISTAFTPLYGALVDNKFIFTDNANWGRYQVLNLTTGVLSTAQFTQLNGNFAFVSSGTYSASDDKIAIICGSAGGSLFGWRADDEKFFPVNVPDQQQITNQRIEYHDNLWMICGYFNEVPATGTRNWGFTYSSSDGIFWENISTYKQTVLTSVTNLPLMPVISNTWVAVRPNTTMTDTLTQMWFRYPYDRTTQFMVPQIQSSGGAYPLIKAQ